MSWLDLASGAGKRLDKMLADQLAQENWARQQAEEERSNRAREEYQTESLKSAAEDRKLQRDQAAANASALRNSRIRDDNRLAAALVQPNTEVSLMRMKQLTDPETGGIPEERFEKFTPYAEDFVGPLQPEGPQRGELLGRWRETPEQAATRASREATEALRAATDADRDRAFQETQRHNREMERLANIREGRLTENAPFEKVFDPSSGMTYLVRRGDVPAGGAAAPKPAAEQTRIDDYKTTVDMIDSLMGDPKFKDDALWQASLGPWDASVAGKFREATGKALFGNEAGGQPGSDLRAAIERLRAQGSFEKGGKSFTATEKQMLESFMALAAQQPEVARQRLLDFRKSAITSLRRMGVAVDYEGNIAPPGGGGVGAIPGRPGTAKPGETTPTTETPPDAYQFFLKNRRARSK